MKLIALFAASVISLYACGIGGDRPDPPKPEPPAAAGSRAEGSAPSDAVAIAAPTPESSAGRPKTVRDFFELLPEKYFVLEGCERPKDTGCKKARAEYLKTFTVVEDTANGYFKGGCDGGQSCIEMAIFKRPAGTYLVGVATSGEMINDFYFLDHKDGKWSDVASMAVPQYSKKNWYELPRFGTTVKVFAKKIVEQGDGFEISEKGKKLYDLEWKDGKFTVRN